MLLTMMDQPQLGFPEYKEAWKFLNRPGDEADIKNCFDSVTSLTSLFLFQTVE